MDTTRISNRNSFLLKPKATYCELVDYIMGNYFFAYLIPATIF